MLMSVVMEHTIAPNHVLTLMEALIVDVIVAIYWILMELIVMDAEEIIITCTYGNNLCIISIYIIHYTLYIGYTPIWRDSCYLDPEGEAQGMLYSMNPDK